MSKKRQINREEPEVVEQPATSASKTLATIILKEPCAFSIRRAMAGVVLFNDGPAMRRLTTDPKKPLTVILVQE